jgi:hypothetical protein
VVLKQIFLRVLLLSPVGMVPRFFPTDLLLHVAITRRTRGRDLATFQEETVCWKYFTLLVVVRKVLEDLHLVGQKFLRATNTTPVCLVVCCIQVNSKTVSERRSCQTIFPIIRFSHYCHHSDAFIFTLMFVLLL